MHDALYINILYADEADENHSYFWMRQAVTYCNLAKRWRIEVESGSEQCSLEAQPPTTECNFEGPTEQNQCKGPRIPSNGPKCNHGFRPISISPCIFPILTYCNPTEEFFSTWRRKVFNRLLTNKSLFSRP